VAIPDYETVMLPLLRFLQDGREHLFRDAVEHVSNEFNLSDAEKEELLPSGRQPIINNRVGWARMYLKNAGLLESPARGYVKITEKGAKVLESNPAKIDVKFLRKFPEFNQWLHGTEDTSGIVATPTTVIESVVTPREQLEGGYQSIRRSLSQELLDLLKKCSPTFFENIVLDVLVKMGYGGSLKDAGKAIGRTGDGGVDGIIKEDKLGLDEIYIQAKRWEGTVGRPEIQKFVGALHGKRTRKGIFITTSDFTGDALEYARTIDPKVILIDGKKLAELMIDYDVGVTRIVNYEIKTVDSDYFSEDQ